MSVHSINIVIPMAGQGSRFSKAGYLKPKPFIDVLGKPMIAHVLENLSVPDARYILIARQEHLEANPQEVAYIQENFNVEFIPLSSLTMGAACTVLAAHRLIRSKTPLLIANSDQLVDCDINEYISDAQVQALDGSILTFEDSDPKWSYVRLNELGLVTEVKEKAVISNKATVGIYYFARGENFTDYALDMIVANDTVNREFYVCPVYNYLIRSHARVGIWDIDKSAMHGIGTPEDLDAYLAWRKKHDN